MKNLKELKDELAFSLSEIESIREQKIKGERVVVKKIVMIRNAILYLEMGTKESSVRRQLSEVEGRLERIEDDFEVWYKNLGTTKNDKKVERPKYFKEMDKPKYESELRFLNYLLD